MAIVTSRMTARIAWAALLILVIAGCAQQAGLPPVVDRTTSGPAAGGAGTGSPEATAQLPRGQPLLDSTTPDAHVVQTGDTLYGIAWRYGLDYRTVARANGIEAPYRIRVGQRLLLADPAAAGPGYGVAGSQGPVAATGPAMLPEEPSSRGFEFIPDTPAEAPPETWQSLPPAPGAGVPPGVVTTPAPAGLPLPAPGLPTDVAAPSPRMGPIPEPVAVPPAGLPGPTAPVASLPAPQSSAPAFPEPVEPLPATPAPAATAPPPPAAGQPAAPPPTPAATVPAPPPAPPAAAPVRSTPATVGTWRWPTSGSVQKGFGNGNKGVDFRLDPGQPIVAAGGGEVVYAGNGLGGFRHLVIVKHDQRFLSAYSLNRPIVVKEGERIESGGMIAGADAASASGAGTLRFEIRRDGQPVDPASVIGR